MQFGSVGTDGRTVALQKLATLSLSADAALPQCCVAQHVPDRHPGRLQTAEKLDPGQDRCVVIPMARLVAVSIGQQPDPLIVTNRMCCQSRAFRQFTNLHEHPSRSTTQRKLGVRARSKSRGNRITVIRAPARCLRRGGASLRFGTGKWTNKVCSPLGEVSLPDSSGTGLPDREKTVYFDRALYDSVCECHAVVGNIGHLPILFR